MIALLVVLAAILAAWGLRWKRRTAPIPIGEGIRAIGRISRLDEARRAPRALDHAARRRRHIRLASTVTLCVLLGALVVSSHRRGLAAVFVVVLLLRVTFEMLAHRPRSGG